MGLQDRGSTFALGKLSLRSKKQFFREKIPLKDIQSLDVADSNSGGGINNALAGGAIGAALFGGAGHVAGSILGGNNKEVPFVCILKDGRKFLGVSDSSDYSQMKQKVMAINF